MLSSGPVYRLTAREGRTERALRRETRESTAGPGFNHLGLSMSEENRKPEKTRGNLATAWKPGQSGNPNGRPKDSRTGKVRALLKEHGEQITTVLVNAALGGDVNAARFLLSLMIAPPRSNPVLFPLPKVNSADTARKALEAIIEAQCDGTLTAEEADSLVRTINMYISITEVNTFADRLKALEESLR